MADLIFQAQGAEADARLHVRAGMDENGMGQDRLDPVSGMSVRGRWLLLELALEAFRHPRAASPFHFSCSIGTFGGDCTCRRCPSFPNQIQIKMARETCDIKLATLSRSPIK